MVSAMVVQGNVGAHGGRHFILLGEDREGFLAEGMCDLSPKGQVWTCWQKRGGNGIRNQQDIPHEAQW